MHCTADTETGDYIDDPTEDQLRDLIAALGQASGTFITITPADEASDWYASISLLPDGARQTERADPAHGQELTATTGSPASIARDLITWITTRD